MGIRAMDAWASTTSRIFFANLGAVIVAGRHTHNQELDFMYGFGIESFGLRGSQNTPKT